MVKYYFLVCFVLFCFMGCSEKSSTGVTTYPNMVKGYVKSDKTVNVVVRRIYMSLDGTSKEVYHSKVGNDFSVPNLEEGQYSFLFTDSDGNMILKYVTIDQEKVIDIGNIENFPKNVVIKGKCKNSSIKTIGVIGMDPVKLIDGSYTIIAPKDKITIFFMDNTSVFYVDVKVPEFSEDTSYIMDFSFDTDSLKSKDFRYGSDIDSYILKPIIYKDGEAPDYYNKAYGSLIYYYDDKPMVFSPYGDSMMLIENFENGEFPRSLYCPITNGWWYTASDPISVCNASIDTLENKNHLDFIADFQEDTMMSFALAGLSFGKKDEAYDFSSCDTLYFRYKSNSIFRVSMETPYLDSSIDNQFGYLFNPSIDWKSAKVPLSQLTQMYDNKLEWKDVADKISRIEFTVGRYIGDEYSNNIYVDIDDIKFGNMSLNNFLFGNNN